MFVFKRKINEFEPQPARIVEFKRDVIILGSLNLSEGQEKNFYVEETLTVDINAHITGNITATNCIVDGKVTGDIICSESLEIGSTAVIEGTIKAKTAVINTGCIVNGEVVLDPNLKAPILDTKIVEAKDYLDKEDLKTSANALSEMEKEVLKKDSNGFNNVPNKDYKKPAIENERTYTKPIEESDTWW